MVGPKSNGWCFYKRKERKSWTQIGREESHVLLEAEIGMMQLQAKEHQGTIGRGKEGFFPRAHSPANTSISDF